MQQFEVSKDHICSICLRIKANDAEVLHFDDIKPRIGQDPKDVEWICTALRSNTVLRKLSLRRNKIGDAEARQLLNVLTRFNVTLRSIDLKSNPVTESVLNELDQVLFRNEQIAQNPRELKEFQDMNEKAREHQLAQWQSANLTGLTKISSGETEMRRIRDQKVDSKTGPEVKIFPRPDVVEKCDVFLCHSGVDKELVLRLYFALQAAGFNCFFDRASLRAGREWKQDIFKALYGCEVGLIVVGHEFFERHWPRNEAATLVMRGTEATVLPVFVHPNVCARGGDLGQRLRDISGVPNHDEMNSRHLLISILRHVGEVLHRRVAASQDNLEKLIKMTDEVASNCNKTDDHSATLPSKAQELRERVQKQGYLDPPSAEEKSFKDLEELLKRHGQGGLATQFRNRMGENVGVSPAVSEQTPSNALSYPSAVPPSGSVPPSSSSSAPSSSSIPPSSSSSGPPSSAPTLAGGPSAPVQT